MIGLIDLGFIGGFFIAVADGDGDGGWWIDVALFLIWSIATVINTSHLIQSHLNSLIQTNTIRWIYLN